MTCYKIRTHGVSIQLHHNYNTNSEQMRNKTIFTGKISNVNIEQPQKYETHVFSRSQRMGGLGSDFKQNILLSFHPTIDLVSWYDLNINIKYIPSASIPGQLSYRFRNGFGFTFIYSESSLAGNNEILSQDIRGFTQSKIWRGDIFNLQDITRPLLFDVFTPDSTKYSLDFSQPSNLGLPGNHVNVIHQFPHFLIKLYPKTLLIHQL